MRREALADQRGLRPVLQRVRDQRHDDRDEDQRVPGVAEHREVGEGDRRRQHGTGEVDPFSPDLVGQLGERRDQHQLGRGADEHRGQHEGVAELRPLHHIHKHVAGEQVERQLLTEPQPGREQDLAPMVAHRVLHRRAGGLLLRHHGREHRRLQDPQPDHQADAHEHQAQQERDPPAPRVEVGAGERGRQQRHATRAEHQPHRNADLGEARQQPATALVTPFHGEQHRAAPLTADRDALHQPQQHQDQRRGEPDRRRARQQPDHGRGQAHQQQRDDQRFLAPEPVAPVPEDRRAHRPCREPDRVGREGLHHPGVTRGRGEEQVREDECRGRVVEEEVVPLDGRADRPGEGRPPHLDPAVLSGSVD
jgi:hypothetical protein